ncbi:MAG: tRNA (adenosine(37)-N6)-threonylcarbamoyltransferase complex dimerization subunit type 1 TsaB [Parachlamydiaceae bacterium]|nr:tRNA (adenosine(37)-N6)-threonylcarbamoyltransferase complex dimerization subunit type 1 TsaB [Parachlamydiaceae bacterium]
MLTLLIETSTERGIVAIRKNDQLVFQKALPFGYQNAQLLLPTIEEGLSDLKCSAQDLSLIASGIGPGSYTGLRIGAMVAKTLAYACQKPLIGICSLETFVPQTSGRFAALIDAKIGGVYLLKGDYNQGKIEYLSEALITPLDTLKTWLDDVEIVVTPNASRLRPLLESQFPHLQWEENSPSPLRMGFIALERWKMGQVNNDLELLYLRQTQAEIEKQK